MSNGDLRWRQRLESLQRALAQLEAALAAHGAEPGNEVIGMAVIKAYEFSFELSWKTLKDLLAGLCHWPSAGWPAVDRHAGATQPDGPYL